MKPAFALLMMFATLASAAEDKAGDEWQAVQFMLGSWVGEASGESGKGTVERSYELVLGGRFIEERNTSRYAASAPGKTPEVRRHRGFLSYDKERKTLMLRHFHEEGVVDLYAMNNDASSAKRLVFESVSFENFNNDWKARETYDLISASDPS